MSYEHSEFALAAIGGELMEQQAVDQILACNEVTAKYGLVLSEQQALALARTRTGALKENQRVEFGRGIMETLISAFCDSPYLTEENYEETLHELISLFYTLKNQTWDRVSDCDLVGWMKETFDGPCHGSLELLSGEALRFSRQIRRGASVKTFGPRED